MNRRDYAFAAYCHLENTIFHIICDTGKGVSFKIFHFLPHQSDVGKLSEAVRQFLSLSAMRVE